MINQPTHGLTPRTLRLDLIETLTRHNFINMGDIEGALAALERLEVGEKPNYTQIAAQYGVGRTTLLKQYRGVQGSRAQDIKNRQLLNTTQEKELVKYLQELCVRGLPPSKQMVRNFASEIAGREAGKCWADHFIKRHMIDLVLRWTSGIDASHYRADSAFKYSLYFKLL